MRRLLTLLAVLTTITGAINRPGSSLEAEIQDQLDILLTISRETGERLSGNQDFYDWLVSKGPGSRLPP